ncbi:hypothetical protein B0H14DRAFT_2559176 [Mycena olivaceomarginata]|nr:hypothetical protein B0H14DRAFT_2559176 [Mycena olivaceomarginata]
MAGIKYDNTVEFVEFAFNQPHQSSSSMAGIQYANVGVCIQVHVWRRLVHDCFFLENVICTIPRTLKTPKFALLRRVFFLRAAHIRFGADLLGDHFVDDLDDKSLSEGRTSGTGENLKSGNELACGCKHLSELLVVQIRVKMSARRALANKVRQMEDPRISEFGFEGLYEKLTADVRAKFASQLVYRRHPEDVSNAQAHVSRLEKILGQTYPTPPEIAQYCFDDSEMGVGEKVYVPPHWLAVHDEIHVVLKGRVIVTQDGVRHVSAPKTPRVLFIMEETATAPEDAEQKIYFFRNLGAPGTLRSPLDIMQVFYFGIHTPISHWAAMARTTCDRGAGRIHSAVFWVSSIR